MLFRPHSLRLLLDLHCRIECFPTASSTHLSLPLQDFEKKTLAMYHQFTVPRVRYVSCSLRPVVMRAVLRCYGLKFLRFALYS